MKLRNARTRASVRVAAEHRAGRLYVRLEVHCAACHSLATVRRSRQNTGLHVQQFRPAGHQMWQIGTARKSSCKKSRKLRCTRTGDGGVRARREGRARGAERRMHHVAAAHALQHLVECRLLQLRRLHASGAMLPVTCVRDVAGVRQQAQQRVAVFRSHVACTQMEVSLMCARGVGEARHHEEVCAAAVGSCGACMHTCRPMPQQLCSISMQHCFQLHFPCHCQQRTQTSHTARAKISAS